MLAINRQEDNCHFLAVLNFTFTLCNGKISNNDRGAECQWEGKIISSWHFGCLYSLFVCNCVVKYNIWG